MTEKYYTETNDKTALRSWAMWQMLRGMGWAAVGTIGIGGILLAIYAVSLLLPAESKQAPSPYTSSIEALQPVSIASA